MPFSTPRRVTLYIPILTARELVLSGASADQDNRFGDKMKKLLKTTKFPPFFDTKVDMAKVQMDVIMPWVTQQVRDRIYLSGKH